MRTGILTILGSFFIFSAFMLELFVMIGQLSNKPFLNILYFVQANNPEYNLSYGFGLWSYCQGAMHAPVQFCSHPVPAYNWAFTPGFQQMLPGQFHSAEIQRSFLALFILYFICLIFSFLLWIATLVTLFVRPTLGLDITLTVLVLLTFCVMLIALIIALVLVIGSVKAVSAASVFWGGHAGLSLWFTIAAVVALFLAVICYLIKTCYYRRGPDENEYHMNTRVDPIDKTRPFDIAQHQPDEFHVIPQSRLQYKPQQGQSNIPSMSEQYSPGLQPQYLSPIYDHQT